VIAAHQVGAAAIAYLAGFIRSMDGSYDHAFILSGTACIVTAIGVLLIGRGVNENTVRPLAERGVTECWRTFGGGDHLNAVSESSGTAWF